LFDPHDPLDGLLAELLADADKAKKWTPYRWQIPPADIPAGMWLLIGGRGIGKTDGSAHYMIDHAHGPACDPRIPGGHRMGIIAPTIGDAIESCCTGPSGLRTYDPAVRVVTRTAGTFAIWPSGAEAKVFGASKPEDVERLRAGGNRCLWWYEELAAWPKLDECDQHARFGLRIGPRPHIIGSTTPKPRARIKALLADPKTVVTRGKTSEAHHLAADVRSSLYAAYAGTRLGRQELEGEMMDDTPGALWTWDMLEAYRLREEPELDRVVVGVDPAVTATEASDETGIVVVGVSGRGDQAHYYVLDDRSGKYSPKGWALATVAAYRSTGADRVVAEVNNGGDMVAATLRGIDASLPVKTVHASRGKKIRAEPVASLYEQGRVHHVGSYPLLEEQMASWDATDPNAKSPDRVDALVWAMTELMGRSGARLVVYPR
jgi:phage terminase large subunit-like protein